MTPSGSMRQRSPGSWELRVYAGVDARSGKVRYQTRTVHGSRAGAARALKEMVASVKAGPAFGAQASFGLLAQTWLASRESTWSASTLTETRSILSRHLVPAFGDTPVGAITTERVDELLSGLANRLAAGSVMRVRGVLHAAMAQAVRWDWIWSNPVTNATRQVTGPKDHVVPAPATVARVLASLRRTDPVLMVFVRLAATTGARRGELLGLRWSDVDFVNGRLSLVRSVLDAAGGPVVQERKTKNANSVDLDADTLELLAEHRRRCLPQAMADGVVVGECPVFARPDDVREPWRPNAVTKRFAVALEDAGVEHFRLHDLRHFVATQLLGTGVGLAVVSARLGHARTSTTLNVYAATMPAWDRAAAEAMSTLIKTG